MTGLEISKIDIYISDRGQGCESNVKRNYSQERINQDNDL